MNFKQLFYNYSIIAQSFFMNFLYYIPCHAVVNVSSVELRIIGKITNFVV